MGLKISSHKQQKPRSVPLTYTKTHQHTNFDTPTHQQSSSVELSTLIPSSLLLKFIFTNAFRYPRPFPPHVQNHVEQRVKGPPATSANCYLFFSFPLPILQIRVYSLILITVCACVLVFSYLRTRQPQHISFLAQLPLLAATILFSLFRNWSNAQ